MSMFPTRTLVATDAPDEAYPAVEAAVELANGTTSELQVVFVVSTAPELPYPKLIAKERNEAYLEQKRLGGLGRGGGRGRGGAVGGGGGAAGSHGRLPEAPGEAVGR